MTSVAELTAHKTSFDNGVQVAWDATSLDAYQRCPRYYYYALIRGVKPKAQSVHLLFGGIYASALEKFYKLRADGFDHEAALREVVRYALTASWDEERGIPLVFEDAAKTRPNLIRTIIWYIEEFEIEAENPIQTYHLENGKPAVELSFMLELSENILYSGHLDRVVEQGGELYVLDQKTTGATISDFYFRTFKPSNQMSGYSFAGQAVLHTPVRGVIIDAAQIAVNFTRFGRGVTTRSKDELTEWYEGAVETITQAQHMTEKEKFPMNPNSCGNYGGCPYRSVCSVSPKVRESYLKSDFTSHDWDPAKAR